MHEKTSKGDLLVAAYPGSGGGASKIGVTVRVVLRCILRVLLMSKKRMRC